MRERRCGGCTRAYTIKMTRITVHMRSKRKKKGMRMNLVSALLTVARLLPCRRDGRVSFNCMFWERSRCYHKWLSPRKTPLKWIGTKFIQKNFFFNILWSTVLVLSTHQLWTKSGFAFMLKHTNSYGLACFLLLWQFPQIQSAIWQLMK